MNLSENAANYLINMALDIADNGEPELAEGAQEVLDAYNLTAEAFQPLWRPSAYATAFLWDFVLSGRDFVRIADRASEEVTELSAILAEVSEQLKPLRH